MARDYKRRTAGDVIGVGKAELVERVDTRLWKMRCTCGAMFIGQPSESKGFCRACAYMYVANKRVKHGESPNHGKKASRLYTIWANMRSRCNNPNAQSYAYYGARGIKVCPKWDEYSEFKKWAHATGYSDDLSIDRIDTDGDYTPENCRWATHKEQMNNTRRNHLLEYGGESMTMKAWSERTGIPYHTLKHRINTYGFTTEEALTRTVSTGNNQTLRRRFHD